MYIINKIQRISEKLNTFHSKNVNRIDDLDNQFKKSEAELHAKIRYTKIDIQENTKLYLNSWKNSNDFKNMLDLIIKAENSGNQKNNY